MKKLQPDLSHIKEQYSLSKDASDIMNISMLTNAYYPEQNITDQEFLKYKSNWFLNHICYFFFSFGII